MGLPRLLLPARNGLVDMTPTSAKITKAVETVIADWAQLLDPKEVQRLANDILAAAAPALSEYLLTEQAKHIRSQILTLGLDPRSDTDFNRGVLHGLKTVADALDHSSKEASSE